MEDTAILIDTCIFIDHLRKKDKKSTLLATKVNKYQKLFVSSVSAFELFSGASDENKINDVKTLLSICKIISFDLKIAEKSSEIYNFLRADNKIIEIRDLFIGSTAITYDLPVLTLNKKHFSRINGLKIIDK